MCVCVCKHSHRQRDRERERERAGLGTSGVSTFVGATPRCVTSLQSCGGPEHFSGHQATRGCQCRRDNLKTSRFRLIRVFSWTHRGRYNRKRALVSKIEISFHEHRDLSTLLVILAQEEFPMVSRYKHAGSSIRSSKPPDPGLPVQSFSMVRILPACRKQHAAPNLNPGLGPL